MAATSGIQAALRYLPDSAQARVKNVVCALESWLLFNAKVVRSDKNVIRRTFRQ